MRVFVILPAAGLGTRMAAGAPKQFLELRGTPILIHTLSAFLALKAVTAVYIAVRKPEVSRLQSLLETYGFAGPEQNPPVHIIEGGDTRQGSVGNALAAVTGGPDDIVLVHDAVRPLIPETVVARTIEAVETHGAAIVALPAVDTIKQVERTAHGAIITSTIPREYVVQAQTPQGFRLGLLRRAYAEAAADGFQGTDESSIVERAGLQVAVVPGTIENLKITHQGDLDLAEFFLSQRESLRS